LRLLHWQLGLLHRRLRLLHRRWRRRLCLLLRRRPTAITFAAPTTLSAIGVVALRGRRLCLLLGWRSRGLRLLCGRRPPGARSVFSPITPTASAATAPVIVVALRSWRRCRRRLRLLHRWRGRRLRLLRGRRAASAGAVFAAITAAAFATLAMTVVVVLRGRVRRRAWGRGLLVGRRTVRGLRNLDDRLGLGLLCRQARQCNGIESGEGNGGSDEITAHKWGLAPLRYTQRLREILVRVWPCGRRSQTRRFYAPIGPNRLCSHRGLRKRADAA
jgi:hypothetical protein